MSPAPEDPEWFAAAQERSRSWNMAMLAAALIIVGELAFAVIERRVHTFRWLSDLRVLHALLCAIIAAVLVARRRVTTPRFNKLAYVIMKLPLLPIFWASELVMSRQGPPWLPFLGHKLVMVAIALLSPPGLVIGGGLIVAMAAEAILLWYHIDARVRAMLGSWEPWLTLLVGAVSFVLLAHRAHSMSVERRFFQARAESEALERIARLFLALRDQTNTPLQTIEIAASILQQRCSDVHMETARIRKAVARVRELTRSLRGLEGLTTWRVGDESLDARAVVAQLRKESEELLRRRRPGGNA